MLRALPVLTIGVGAPRADGDQGNPSDNGTVSGPYANGINGGHQEWWQWYSIEGTPHGYGIVGTLVPTVAKAHKQRLVI